MKTNRILAIVLLAAMSFHAAAQDTVNYYDPWYTFNTAPNNPRTGPYFDLLHSNLNQCYMSFYNFTFLQPYPGTTDIIYGLAVTPMTEMSEHTLYCYQGVNISNCTEGPALVYITVSEADSIQTWDAPLLKKCKFKYEYIPGFPDYLVSDCYEYYFESPITLRYNDTIYIGGRAKENTTSNFFYGLFDLTGNQRWYMYGQNGIASDCSQWPDVGDFNDYRYKWGVIFPIVKLRCTVPRGLHIEDGGSDVTALWHANTDADLFQLSVCQGNTPADSGIFISTTDTSLALQMLMPDSTYNVYLRKQCAYCTSSWADTVWSDWSEPVTVNAPSEGIAGVRQPSFSLAPNPASTAVTVKADSLGTTLHIELLDLDGHVAASQTSPSSSATLLLEGLPRGAYFVRVTSTNGTAVQKLIVR